MSTHCLINADLSVNLISRRSQTGVLIFSNRTMIIGQIKRQNAVETSTFESEMIPLKNGVELVEALRYKLRMFGAPIDGKNKIYSDNEAVYKNCSVPESTFRKKHHSIAYHRNREAVAAGMSNSQKRTQRQISVTCSPRYYQVLWGKNYWTDSCTEWEKRSWCFIPNEGLHHALGCGVFIPKWGFTPWTCESCFIFM